MYRSDPIANRFGRILHTGRRAASAVLALALAGCAPTTEVTDTGAGEPRFDGLEPVKGANVAMAYVDPEADFSVYQRVAILDPHVAFRKNWQRDQNRSRGLGGVRSSDIERIKADGASLFKEVFAERLQADDGYEVVDESGYDVLLIRPAIVDLDITAPDTQAPGRGRTYTAGAGAATLYIELYDSVSGDILGRAADRQIARETGMRLSWSNRVNNKAEARRIFRRWADQLRHFLAAHYTK